MKDDMENLLEHTFHDSNLLDIEREDNKTTLVIDTDIYWYPGKPFTLLTLVNADEVIRMREIVGRNKKSSESIKEARITRSEKSGKNFALQIELHSSPEVEIHCYNFWAERKEEYKDYQNATFR